MRVSISIFHVIISAIDVTKTGKAFAKRAIAAANVECALHGGSGTARTVTLIVSEALDRDKDS